MAGSSPVVQSAGSFTRLSPGVASVRSAMMPSFRSALERMCYYPGGRGLCLFSPVATITLPRVDLGRRILKRADLREADLRGATLRGVVLTDADLRGAVLSGPLLCAFPTERIGPR
ncbi:hypothetical protein Ari01nite_29820 [Paractinoplanes rishiriensis]|uniref:Pentapeptide repeat-containing protein n=2 Tax=Paractinoplanes rishiriensis TaxID=1050105 RepID=A0A919JY97_9ACTN|nr:hypothetical protein Ari01nite_29820 [Actinoplanes rishiriensis]